MMKHEEVRQELESVLHRLGRQYNETVEQLRPLVSYWETAHETLYRHGREAEEFSQSFDAIRRLAARNEFCELQESKFHVSPGESLAIFDEIDRLFSRLSFSNYGREFFQLLGNARIFHDMNSTGRKLSAIISASCNVGSPTKVYLLCFAFMLAMEGYYDELIRLVYAVEHLLSTGHLPDLLYLKHEAVDKMMNDVKVKLGPNVRGIWPIGHHVRNAIAHARFDFVDENQTIRFVDVGVDNKKKKVKVTDMPVKLSELTEMYSRIGTVGRALSLLLTLLMVYTVLIVPATEFRIVHGGNDRPASTANWRT